MIIYEKPYNITTFKLSKAEMSNEELKRKEKTSRDDKIRRLLVLQYWDFCEIQTPEELSPATK